MTTHTESLRTLPATLPLRSVALVGRDAHRHLQTTVQSAVGYDVVFVESPAHAYSTIKRVRPDLVIVCVSSDAPDGCQVLSMLTLDADTARIPVLAYFTPALDSLSGDDAPDADPDPCSQFVGPVSLN